MSTRHRYRREVLSALDHHGFRPTVEHDPERVYELLKSLYTFEIRQLRSHQLEKERVLGPQPIEDFRRRLVDLKGRYAVLTTHWHHWTERGTGPSAPTSTQPG